MLSVLLSKGARQPYLSTASGITRHACLQLPTTEHKCRRYTFRISIYLHSILLFLAASQYSFNSFQSQRLCARAQILKLARWHVPFVRFRVHHVSFQLKWTHVEQWSCWEVFSLSLPFPYSFLPPLFSEWNHPICFRHLSNHTSPSYPLSVPSVHTVQLSQIRDPEK